MAFASLLAALAASTSMFQLGPTEASSVAAEPVIATVVRRAPQGQPIGKISTHGPWAGQRVRLLVLGGALDSTGRRWLRVRLLRRPNESDGWIPYDRVRIVRNPWRVEIIRATKELWCCAAAPSSRATRSPSAARHAHAQGPVRDRGVVPHHPARCGAVGDRAHGLLRVARLVRRRAGPRRHPRRLGAIWTHGCVAVPPEVIERLAAAAPGGHPGP